MGARLGTYQYGFPIKVVCDKRRGGKVTELEPRNLTVKAHAFTRSAAKMIMEAGGRCLLLRPKTQDIVEEVYHPDVPKAERYIFSGKISKRERRRRELLKKVTGEQPDLKEAINASED